MDRQARNAVSDTVFVNLTKKPLAIENKVHLASGTSATSISSLTYIYAIHLYSLPYLALLSGFKICPVLVF
jgi:hypothetical protein